MSAVEGGHVEDIEAANKVIREIIAARNRSRSSTDTDPEEEEKLAEETSIAGADPLPDPPEDLSPAEQLLTESLRAIRDRRGSYGHPRDHFARTVGMINAAFADRLTKPFEPSDWALMIILDKVARHLGPKKRDDSPVDIAGYASLLAEVETRDQ